MSKPYLFVWEDSYSLYHTLQERKRQFIEKHWETWLFELKGDDMDLSVIKNALLNGWFFSEKKCVFLHWIPKESSPTFPISTVVQQSVEWRLIDHLSKHRLDDMTTLVLVCNKPDKRTKARKFFSAEAQLKEFKPPKAPQCAQFIKSKLKDIISTDQARYIVELVWNNLWNLHNETEKLSLYAAYHNLTTVTNQQIQDIVFHQWSINAFGLLDTIFTDPAASLKTIDQIKQQTSDIFQIHWMINRWMRITLQMIDCAKQWINSSSVIAKKIKAPPFAIAKQMKHLTRYQNNEEKIQQFFCDLLAIDYNIKTWKLPSQWYRVSLKQLIYWLWPY